MFWNYIQANALMKQLLNMQRNAKLRNVMKLLESAAELLWIFPKLSVNMQRQV